jgi:peptide/nickel transport system permease protein
MGRFLNRTTVQADGAVALELPRPAPARRRAGTLLRNLPVLPAVILAIVVIAALVGPALAPHGPAEGFITEALQPPVWQRGGTTNHLLGTDVLGRDIFSRLLYGARVSLEVGIIAVGLAGTVGVTLGLLAGYFGGWPDVLIMRWLDIQMSVPAILLALLLTAVFSPGLTTVIAVVIVVYWTGYARLVRGETLAVKQRDYVQLARVAGLSHRTIILRHILPNVFNSVIVVATLQLGSVIIFEASLSFLGLGVQSPQVAWGSMLAEGRQYVRTAWWISVIPGLAIMLVVLSINLLGDWLRDRLDPKLRQL